MRFYEIAEIIEANKTLVGKKFKGATIDELVCIPVGYETEFEQFYIYTFDGKQALTQLTNEIGQLDTNAEYQIYAVVGKSYIR